MPRSDSPSTPDGALTCLVEVPKGSRNKYRWDPEQRAITLDRLLFASVAYPIEYGFIPETLASDGDPLDAMVCVSAPTFPGCLIEVKPIALLRIEHAGGTDDKVLCVPAGDPQWSGMDKLEDLPRQLRDEISHFFSIYQGLDRDESPPKQWHSRREALGEIEAARERLAGRGPAAEADPGAQGEQPL
jgi:inorganic pyrophosphatase